MSNQSKIEMKNTGPSIKSNNQVGPSLTSIFVHCIMVVRCFQRVATVGFTGP